MTLFSLPLFFACTIQLHNASCSLVIVHRSPLILNHSSSLLLVTSLPSTQKAMAEKIYDVGVDIPFLSPVPSSVAMFISWLSLRLECCSSPVATESFGGSDGKGRSYHRSMSRAAPNTDSSTRSSQETIEGERSLYIAENDSLWKKK